MNLYDLKFPNKKTAKKLILTVYVFQSIMRFPLSWELHYSSLTSSKSTSCTSSSVEAPASLAPASAPG